MSYYENETLCPKCGHYSTNAEACEHCGALISKIREREQQRDVEGNGLPGDEKPVFAPVETEPGVSYTAITVVLILLGVAGGISYYKMKSDDPTAEKSATVAGAPKVTEPVIADPQATPIYNFAKREEAANATPQKQNAQPAATAPKPEEPGVFSSIAEAIAARAQKPELPQASSSTPSPQEAPQIATAQPTRPVVAAPPAAVPGNSNDLSPITIGDGEIASSNFSLKASEQPRKAVTTPATTNPAATSAQPSSGGLGKRNVVVVDSSSFSREVLSHNQEPVLVDFYATWCGPCKRLAPQLEVFAGLNDGVKVVKVDIDQSRDLAMKYKIQSVPTLMLFKNGQMLGRNSGVPSMAQLQESIKPHL